MLATRHRTAESRRLAPTPTIAPVIVCVVLTGIPPNVTPMIPAAAAVSALKPPIGLSFVMRAPIVLTMRHPPRTMPF